MAPVGNPSLFMRFFGLAENVPLYAMLGIACGLAVYTPVRHFGMTASDVALNTRMRDPESYMNGDSEELVVKKALRYHGGVLGSIGHASTFGPYKNTHPELLPSNRTFQAPTHPVQS